MPHKHRREKDKNDAFYYDLPPSKSARALPVKRAATAQTSQSHTRSTKRKSARLDDDTPRAFTRLLTGYRPPRSGLDDGIRPSKKRKISKATAENETIAPPPSLRTPTIQPHEPLSSFNARVDAALPFNGLSKRSGGVKEVDKGRKTKTERKMQKMQKEWRDEERRRREKLEEEGDEATVNEDAVDDILKGANTRKQKGGRRKRSGENGVEALDDEDPWAHIQAKPIQDHNDRPTNGLIGLHDVVLAPPQFSKLPKGKENVNIGLGSGGLKRQAELSEARKSVVDGYRQMVKEKRAKD